VTGSPAPPELWALTRYFLRLGSLGFGGPVALVGAMQRDLVEARGWFTRETYMKGLALSQLAPVSFGPEVSAVGAPARPPLRWDDVPALSTDFEAGRAAILARLPALLGEVSR
jgi:Chromate transporter